jgi:hypothetical protein
MICIMSAEFPKQEPVPVQEDKETKIARLRAELAALENEGSEEEPAPEEIESSEKEPAASDQHAEERATANASALAGVRERLGMVARNEAKRPLPTEMEDADLEKTVHDYHKRKKGLEDALHEKSEVFQQTKRAFTEPIYNKIDTLLADKGSFPDTETYEQLTTISNRGFQGALNKLQDEEVLARVGKAILFLAEKGVLTDEIIAEGAAIQEIDDSLDAEAREIELGTEDPDRAYEEEYSRRELER